MTKTQRLKDERVLAAIIAGGEGSGRAIFPALGRGGRSMVGYVGHGNAYGVERDRRELDGPACAVGAGLLFAGFDRVTASPIKVFALTHDVTERYARGISDGFEGYVNDNSRFDDYRRGVDVGESAFDYFCGEDDE